MEKEPLVAGILQVVSNKLQGVVLTEQTYMELHDALRLYLEWSGVLHQSGREKEALFRYPDLKWPV